MIMNLTNVWSNYGTRLYITSNFSFYLETNDYCFKTSESFSSEVNMTLVCPYTLHFVFTLSRLHSKY